MKLVLLALVICSVGAQFRPQKGRYCRRSSDCLKGETCVFSKRYFYRYGYCQLTLNRLCRSGSDCGANECCESTAQLRGRKKRQIGGSDGVCKLLQSSGNSCLIQYPSGKPSTTVLQCPCTSDLQCVADGGRIVPQGFTGVCSVPAAPVACQTGADCGPDECCKSRVRPIGRKKRQISGGVCEPLGAAGDSCFANAGSGKPEGVVFSCPCRTGLSCGNITGIDIPLGPFGSCGLSNSD